MGWSDLPSDLVISVATRLQDPIDYARFRAVCRSWESAVRGFRPVFFPLLAVIPGNLDPNKDKLSFISRNARNDCIYKRPMPCSNIDLKHSNFSYKDGWIMFVLKDGVPIIVNPVTGAQLQPLPSLYTLRRRRRQEQIDFVVFLSDNLVAFAEFCVPDRYHVLAAATPGDDEWSVIRLSSSFYMNNINSIVFHEADRKFYALHRKGDMQSFRLTRCGRKTVFGQVSYINAKARQDLLIDSHLMSDGTNLLRVRRRRRTKDFEILKYCPDADMWEEVINMDYLGNNSLFFDRYGARMLPLPLPEGGGYLQREEEGRPRRNCIYYTDYDEIPPLRKKEAYQYVHYVRVYDVGKGTVESCFSTNIQSNHHLLPALMWFTPSLSVKN